MDDLTGKCGGCFWWEADEVSMLALPDVTGECCIDPAVEGKRNTHRACSRYTGKQQVSFETKDVPPDPNLTAADIGKIPDGPPDDSRVDPGGAVGVWTMCETCNHFGFTTHVLCDQCHGNAGEIPDPQTITMVDCKAYGGSAGFKIPNPKAPPIKPGDEFLVDGVRAQSLFRAFSALLTAWERDAHVEQFGIDACMADQPGRLGAIYRARKAMREYRDAVPGLLDLPITIPDSAMQPKKAE